MKMCAKLLKDFDAVIITKEGQFEKILLKKDDVFPLITNDCGPVGITMNGIVLPNNSYTVIFS